MQRSSMWLVVVVAVHGIAGCFAELLTVMLNRLATPLGQFFNVSFHEHYGDWLQPDDVQMTFFFMSNLSLAGNIVTVLLFLPHIDSWGRRYMAVYGRALCTSVAALLIVGAQLLTSFELFALGMFFVGVNGPLQMGVTKLYVSECAPDATRGLCTQSISTLSHVVHLLSGVLCMPAVFGNVERWHWIALISFSMTQLFVPLGHCLPESPKFLAFRGANKSEVVDVLRKFHGNSADIESVLDSYNHEFRVTRTRHTSLRELWQDLGLRASLLLVFATAITSTFSSVTVFAVYAVPLKIECGFSNEQALLCDMLIGVTLFPVFMSLPVMYEKIGRRPVYLATLIFSTCSGLTMCAALLVKTTSGVGVATVILGGLWSLFVILSVGLGGSVFFVILLADLLPASAKAVTAQVALLMHAVAAMVVNFGYAALQPVLGPYIFLPLAGVPFFCFLFCMKHLPETRRKAVYENFENVRSRAQSQTSSLLRSRASTRQFEYGTLPVAE